MVCRIVFQIFLLELIEFIHPVEVHEHLFHKAVIDRIVLWKMVAGFGGVQVISQIKKNQNIRFKNNVISVWKYFTSYPSVSLLDYIVTGSVLGIAMLFLI